MKNYTSLQLFQVQCGLNYGSSFHRLRSLHTKRELTGKYIAELAQAIPHIISIPKFNPTSLFFSLSIRRIPKIFQNSALGYVKRIHQKANQLNNLALDKIDPQWFTGFIDGEGCFHLSITPSKKHKLG